MPRLSIILATYNAAATLERCLHSIVSQSYKDLEIIIADGRSTDRTLDVVLRFRQQIAHWHSRSDAGIYDAWNQGLSHASGEYVTFLGADDAWRSPDTLQRIMDAIGENEYDLVTSRGVVRDADWVPLEEVGGPWNYTAAPRRMGIIHPGLLHRRELFIRHGLFDASLRIVGDLDFLLRLPEQIRTLDLTFATVDIQNDGISRKQFWRRLRERWQVHARCARVGTLRANLYWLDKAWRMPIARLFGLQH